MLYIISHRVIKIQSQWDITTPTAWLGSLKLKRLKIASVGEAVEQLECSCFAGGLQGGTATLADSFDSFYKV